MHEKYTKSYFSDRILWKPLSKDSEWFYYILLEVVSFILRALNEDTIGHDEGVAIFERNSGRSECQQEIFPAEYRHLVSLWSVEVYLHLIRGHQWNPWFEITKLGLRLIGEGALYVRFYGYLNPPDG